MISVMNGFRADLSHIMLSFEPNARIYGGAIADASLPTALQRVRAIPGVVEAYPAIESEALVQSDRAATGALVRGLAPADLQGQPPGRRQHQGRARWRRSAQGADGGDGILIGSKHGRAAGRRAGRHPLADRPDARADRARQRAGAEGLHDRRRLRSRHERVRPASSSTAAAPGPAASSLRQAPVDFIWVRFDNPDKAPEARIAMAAAAGDGAVIKRLDRGQRRPTSTPCRSSTT